MVLPLGSHQSPQLCIRSWLTLYVSLRLGRKTAFQWARAFCSSSWICSILCCPLTVSLDTVIPLYLSTGIINTKPPSSFKNSSFSPDSSNTSAPPPFFLSCQNPWNRSIGNPFPVLQQGSGRETPLPLHLVCGRGPCPREGSLISDKRKTTSLPSQPQPRQAIVVPTPTPFPSPAAPPFHLQWHPGRLRQYSHMSVTCARAEPMGWQPTGMGSALVCIQWITQSFSFPTCILHSAGAGPHPATRQKPQPAPQPAPAPWCIASMCKQPLGSWCVSSHQLIGWGEGAPPTRKINMRC